MKFFEESDPPLMPLEKPNMFFEIICFRSNKVFLYQNLSLMKNCCILEYSSNKINKVVNPISKRNKHPHTKNTHNCFLRGKNSSNRGKRKTHKGSQPPNLSTNKNQSYRDYTSSDSSNLCNTISAPSILYEVASVSISHFQWIRCKVKPRQSMMFSNMIRVKN